MKPRGAFSTKPDDGEISGSQPSRTGRSRVCRTDAAAGRTLRRSPAPNVDNVWVTVDSTSSRFGVVIVNMSGLFDDKIFILKSIANHCAEFTFSLDPVNIAVNALAKPWRPYSSSNWRV